MISKDSIDALLDKVNIVDIIQRDVPLKKAGKEWKGKSPFSDEKSASFFVSEEKGVFKCFSSGYGGGVIKYLDLKHGMDFITAIRFLANFCNHTLQEVEDTEEDRERLSQRQMLTKVLMASHRRWQQELANQWKNSGPAAEYLNMRGITPEIAAEWEMGYAPDQWRWLTPHIMESGYWKAGSDLGLIQSSRKNENGDAKNFDGLRHRITFAINHRSGGVIAAAGRYIGEDKGVPKYINSPEHTLYQKSKVLYGIDRALRGIRNKGFVIITEGYFDVVSMHLAGWDNTVAVCGTAIGAEHARILAKYTHRITLALDGDDAGMKAVERCLPDLWRADMEVKLAVLPKGEDPDSLARNNPNVLTECLNNAHDALLYMAHQQWAQCTSPQDKQQCTTQAAAMVAHFSGQVAREAYVEELAAVCKGMSKRTLKSELKKQEALQQERAKIKGETDPFLGKLPEGVDPGFVNEFGFYALNDGKKTGYYFMVGPGRYEKQSNFVLDPLFHRVDDDDSGRIMRINNGRGGNQLIEISSKVLVSNEQFKAACFNKGQYFWMGKSEHLNKLINYLLYAFPKAHQLKILGWQEEGFFAFQNYIYNGKLERFNEIGLVKHGEDWFFSPSASSIRADLRAEDDKYEYDKVLTYIPCTITFSDWAAQMHRVYAEHSLAAIGFVFITAFRDVVFALDNNCPFFYIYGPKSSGKSTLANSVNHVFFQNKNAFNINQGTDFAFFHSLSRFRNCVAWFNEFDDNAIKKEWLQSIKGAFDGEGRTRGRDKNTVEVQKVVSTIMITGQYLSTSDDNSISTRSIVRLYRNEEYSEEDVAEYSKLIGWEKTGITGILSELFKFRREVEELYPAEFGIEFRWMTAELAKKSIHNARIIRNYCTLLTMWKIFGRWYKLPSTHEDYRLWVLKEVANLHSIIQTTDILTEFWATIEMLLANGQLTMGNQLKVKRKAMEVRVDRSVEGKPTGNICFKEPRDLLYVRMGLVQKEYAKAMRSAGGTVMSTSNINNYLGQRGYYIGFVSSEKFIYDVWDRSKGETRKISLSTSALVFDLAQMMEDGMNIGYDDTDTGEEYDRNTIMDSSNPEKFLQPKNANYGENTLPF